MNDATELQCTHCQARHRSWAQHSRINPRVPVTCTGPRDGSTFRTAAILVDVVDGLCQHCASLPVAS